MPDVRGRTVAAAVHGERVNVLELLEGVSGEIDVNRVAERHDGRGNRWGSEGATHESGTDGMNRLVCSGNRNSIRGGAREPRAPEVRCCDVDANITGTGPP